MRTTLLAVGLLLTACGTGTSTDASPAEPTRQESPAPSAEPSPSESPAKPSPARKGTEIISAGSDYGTMLYDATGQPIYLFDAEPGDRPRCYDECAEAWPPVLTQGEPRARGVVRPALLGTTRRADGRTQVTYAGHPLYFYAHEGKYEVLCHDVEEYGGTWLVVRPDGSPAPG